MNPMCVVDEEGGIFGCIGSLLVLVFCLCWFSACVGFLLVLVFCLCWFSACVGFLLVLVFCLCWFSACVGSLLVRLGQKMVKLIHGVHGQHHVEYIVDLSLAVSLIF